MTQEDWAGLVVAFKAAIEANEMYAAKKTSILGIITGELFSACAGIVNTLVRKGIGENEIREFMRGYGFKPEQVKMFVGE